MQQAEYERKYLLFTDLVRNLRGSDILTKPLSSSCNWVPSALLYTENKSRFCLCYGGVAIIPRIIKIPPWSGYPTTPVTPRQPSDFRKYYPPNHQPTQSSRRNSSKQSNNKQTSARNNSSGATCFPFKGVVDSPKSNSPSFKLELKDRLTSKLQWNLSQRNPNGLIRHPDKPQRNVRMQNNIRAHMSAQRAVQNSRSRLLPQMESRQAHSGAGSSGNQGNTGGQKNRSSSASVAAGFGAGIGVGAVLGSHSRRGGSDDDIKKSKYVPWGSGTWVHSDKGSYMKKRLVHSHIVCRGVDYVKMTIDGKIRWLSLHPSGYKFNLWSESQTKGGMKLTLIGSCNANGKKGIKEHKQSE